MGVHVLHIRESGAQEVMLEEIHLIYRLNYFIIFSYTKIYLLSHFYPN